MFTLKKKTYSYIFKLHWLYCLNQHEVRPSDSFPDVLLSFLSSAFKTCECRAARDCERSNEHMFCVKLTRSQRNRDLDLCSMAALKCASYEFEILGEGACASR